MTLFRAHCFQLSLLLLALGLTTHGWAQQTALSPAVGVEKLTFSAFGETSRAVPLRKSAVWVGRIAEELPDGLLCLDADWAPGAFGMIEGEPRYLLEIRSGSLRGLTLPIIANGQQKLQVALPPEAIRSGALQMGEAGDVVAISPVFTMGELLGEAGHTIFDPVATLPSPADAASRISIIDQAVPRLAERYASTLVPDATDGWVRLEDATPASNRALLPREALLIQNFESLPAELWILGSVQEEGLLRWLPATAGSAAIPVVLGGSNPVVVESLSGLVPDLLTASLSALEREDELLWFEPDQPGFDRPVDRRWFYLDGSGWAEAGGLESPTLTLQPGELLWIQRRRPLAEQLWRQF